MKIIILSLLLIISNFVQSQLKWETNIDSAVHQSISTNKPIMFFFTGSDWCGWCIRLQKEVFSTEDFKTWASENVVLLEIDFPKDKYQSDTLKSQNQFLQKQFKVMGYPTVHFVSPKDGINKINLIDLGQTGYIYGGPKKWILEAESIINNQK